MFNPYYQTDPHIAVSPVSLKDALNFSPRIAAHVLPYFGQAKHLNVGYTMQDPAVAQADIAFLKARGVDFVIFDWYGSDDKFSDVACSVWVAECAKQGMNYAFCFDRGIINFHCPKTQTPTDYMKQQVKYALAKYGSANWERTADGRYLALEFGWETLTTLDAGAVLSAFPNVAMLWQNASGYGRPKSAGAFGWVGVDPNNPQGCIEAYQKNFLAAAATHPRQIAMASLCKGFDDHNRTGGDTSQSCWGGPARFADEKQGQTLLNDIALLNAATVKPAYLQWVTWNDHEEGTNDKWGVDSQLTVSISRDGSVVSGVITGNMNTVDHTECYVDGNLIVTGLSVDLNALNLQIGEHSIQFVAVGKALFQNKYSDTLKTTSQVVWS